MMKLSRARRLSPLFVLLFGCSSKAATDSPSSTAPAESTSPVTPPGPAAKATESAPVSPATSSARPAEKQWAPMRIAPPIPEFQMGMMDHLLPEAGWTHNGSALGYSTTIAVSLESQILRPNGSRERFHAETDNPAEAAKLIERVKSFGFLGERSGNWLYSDDLEITWRASGDCEKEPPETERIEVGARLPGEPGAYPIKLALKNEKGLCFGKAHPELIAISPNGQYLGAIAHGFAGEWANDYPMGIVPIAEVVEGAYNNAGLAHHKAGDYTRSAELFAKAAEADRTNKTAAFNLACALARLGDARAESALKDAIARGGDEIKEKAKKDADFDGVRGAPWFQALTK